LPSSPSQREQQPAVRIVSIANANGGDIITRSSAALSGTHLIHILLHKLIQRLGQRQQRRTQHGFHLPPVRGGAGTACSARCTWFNLSSTRASIFATRSLITKYMAPTSFAETAPSPSPSASASTSACACLALAAARGATGPSMSGSYLADSNKKKKHA
jgi:hypothetical protein